MHFTPKCIVVLKNNSCFIYLFYLFIYFRHFIIPFGKFGHLLLLRRRSHSGHLTCVRLQQPHAGSFRVSVIHRTLTWTTGHLMCVRDRSYACVYTRRLDTPTANQHNMFDSEKLKTNSCAPDGIRTIVLWILSPTLYHFIHPVTTQVWRGGGRSSRCFPVLPAQAGFEPPVFGSRVRRSTN